VGLLFYFKYAAFATGVLKDVGLLANSLPAQALPIGISFFTFQQIAYVVDRARGIAPTAGPLRYLLFISFFPHLLAGPITHHAQMIPQMGDPKPSRQAAALGVFLFAIGVCKKSALADPLGVFASAGFGDPGALTVVGAWSAVLAYTMQLYFDFSGYSDMAIGLGLLFGVRLPWNFLSPYQSTSISEFWRRWHITLGAFLREYLFIPLGGSRRGPVRTSVNLFTTMLLGGIWHGAGWTFVLWGVLHGGALVINHRFRAFKIPMPKIVGWALTAAVVVMGWVLFRSAPTTVNGVACSSLQTAGHIYARMFGQADRWFNPADRSFYLVLPYLITATVIALFAPNASRLSERFRPSLPWALYTGILLALALLFILGQTEAPEFLYFDF